MQKKIIVLAIAAALSVPTLALADTANVTIYGVANLSFDSISTGTNTAGTAGVSKLVVSSNQSRLGLKGSEDLGDGMSAVWQIESLIAMDNAGGSLGLNRNTFAGLKSDSMGSVLLGRHDTPYMMSTRKLDLFTDSLADSRGLMGGGTSGAAANVASAVGFDGRQPDSLVYISPTFSGFNAAFSRINTAEAVTATNSALSSIISLAGMYNAGPIYASFAYESHSFTAAGAGGASTQEKSMKAGFSFAQDAFTANVVVEKSSDDFGAGKTNAAGHTTFYVAGKFNVASGAIKAAVVKAGKLGTTLNTGAQQISLGYDHNLSKRTVAYALYTKVSNQAAVNYGLAGNSSGGGATTRNGLGADPSAISFGVKHSF